MGNAGGGPARPLAADEVTARLRTLGDAGAAVGAKTAAFAALRDHFLRRPTQEEKFAAVAAVDAQRYTVWPCPPPEASALPASVLADKVRGLVYGAALGDAVGLATEFLNRNEVKAFYGDGFAYSPRPSKVFPDTHRLMWVPGDWTDDTDQLILILQSLLATEGRADPCDFARRLSSWRKSGFSELGDESAAGLGQHTKNVISKQGFETTPHEVARDCWEKGGCKSAANGAVMRTAITGVPFFWSRDVVAGNTADLCQVTHADPRCIASCLVVAVCVSEMLRGAPTTSEAEVDELIATAVAEASSRVPASAEEVLNGTGSCTLQDLQLDEPHSIGYTGKCLAAGLWGLRSQASFESAIGELVAEGGDADTNAAVAGALLGCRLGFSKLPSDWIAELPYASWLEAYVQKLLFMLQLR